MNNSQIHKYSNAQHMYCTPKKLPARVCCKILSRCKAGRVGCVVRGILLQRVLILLNESHLASSVALARKTTLRNSVCNAQSSTDVIAVHNPVPIGLYTATQPLWLSTAQTLASSARQSPIKRQGCLAWHQHDAAAAARQHLQMSDAETNRQQQQLPAAAVECHASAHIDFIPVCSTWKDEPNGGSRILCGGG